MFQDRVVELVSLAPSVAKERRGLRSTPTWVWGSKESWELLDPEGLQGKQENLAEMDCLASREPLDLQATPASAQSERKDFQDSQVLRVAPAAPVSPASATSGPPAFAESLETPVYRDCQGSQVCLDREAKRCLVSTLVRLETPVCLVYPDDQALKGNQVSQEVLDVQGSMVPKEREETPVLEANLDHKVSLDPEGTLESQVPLDRRMMAAGGRMVFQDVLEPKASLGRCWEPHLELQDGTGDLESLETRANLGHREDLDRLVSMLVLVFLA